MVLKHESFLLLVFLLPKERHKPSVGTTKTDDTVTEYLSAVLYLLNNPLGFTCTVTIYYIWPILKVFLVLVCCFHLLEFLKGTLMVNKIHIELLYVL